MTVKQLLFAALIFSTMNNIALGTNQKQTLPNNIIPALRFIHHIQQEDTGYEQNTTLASSIALMDKKILNKFEAMPEEDGFIRSIKCPCSIKGLPSEITLYNPKNPYFNENEFNPCIILEKELLGLSQENFILITTCLSSRQ